MTPPTIPKRDAAYIELVKHANCCCCGAPGPSDAQHLRTGQGTGQRAPDYLAVPLCKECHQGVNGVHGDRQRLRQHKITHEIGLLAIWIGQREQLYVSAIAQSTGPF